MRSFHVNAPMMVLALCLGCTSAFAEEEVPLVPLGPEEEAAALALAQVIGKQMFRHDRAASKASDALIRARGFRQHARGMQGWVTEDLGDRIAVTFYGRTDAGNRVALYRATIKENGRLDGRAQRLSTPEPLTEYEQAAARAREAALELDLPACSDRYNTLTLPPIDGSNWRVYLLPATTERNVVPVGGAYRFQYDPDRAQIVEQRPFTYSCLTLQDRRDLAAFVITHLLDPVPTELHVFLNLNAGKPFYLSIPELKTFWQIEDGEIRALKREQTSESES